MKQIRIGRNNDNDVVIDDNSVSRYHATLIENNGVYLLSDNNSSNGSFVNGSRLADEIELKENDIVKLGNVLFPWMKHVGLKDDQKPKTIISGLPIEPVISVEPKPIAEKEAVKKSVDPKIVLPEAPKSLGNSVLKKIVGTVVLLLGLGIILIGAVIFTSVSGTGDIAIVGLAALIIGLILLIVGIVRVSTKSKSQVRKEAELLAHSKYQAAIISAQNGESPTSDEIIENLEKLSLLKKQGILSKQEFEREKKKIIG
jgi:hypothetical protein